MPNTEGLTISNQTLTKYNGQESTLIIPNGIVDIDSEALDNWKGRTIVLPSSLNNYLYENGLSVFNEKSSYLILPPDIDLEKLWNIEQHLIDECNRPPLSDV